MDRRQNGVRHGTRFVIRPPTHGYATRHALTRVRAQTKRHHSHMNLHLHPLHSKQDLGPKHLVLHSCTRRSRTPAQMEPAIPHPPLLPSTHQQRLPPQHAHPHIPQRRLDVGSSVLVWLHALQPQRLLHQLPPELLGLLCIQLPEPLQVLGGQPGGRQEGEGLAA